MITLASTINYFRTLKLESSNMFHREAGNIRSIFEAIKPWKRVTELYIQEVSGPVKIIDTGLLGQGTKTTLVEFTNYKDEKERRRVVPWSIRKSHHTVLVWSKGSLYILGLIIIFLLLFIYFLFSAPTEITDLAAIWALFKLAAIFLSVPAMFFTYVTVGIFFVRDSDPMVGLGATFSFASFVLTTFLLWYGVHWLWCWYSL